MLLRATVRSSSRWEEARTPCWLICVRWARIDVHVAIKPPPSVDAEVIRATSAAVVIWPLFIKTANTGMHPENVTLIDVQSAAAIMRPFALQGQPGAAYAARDR